MTFLASVSNRPDIYLSLAELIKKYEFPGVVEYRQVTYKQLFVLELGQSAQARRANEDDVFLV